MTAYTRVWVIEGETEWDCKASCAAGSPAKWRAEPARWGLMIRWQMNWAQMASTSSLPGPAKQQQFYIFALCSLVIFRSHLYLFFSLTFTHILWLAVAGSQPSAPLSLEIDQFSFAGKAFVRWKEKAVKVYCPLIDLLMFNSCWLIKGDTVQNEPYTVTQMDPGEHTEECTMIMLLISISFQQSCMRYRTLCLHTVVNRPRQSICTPP